MLGFIDYIGSKSLKPFNQTGFVGHALKFIAMDPINYDSVATISSEYVDKKELLQKNCLGSTDDLLVYSGA